MRISDWSSDVCSSDLSFSMPSRNRCGRCGEQGAANRSRGHASREAARQGKLHKRSAEAPAIDARSGQASESTNEANDARGCSEVRRMATPTSGPPLVCAKRSEEHTSELQSLMRTSSAVFCSKKKKTH